MIDANGAGISNSIICSLYITYNISMDLDFACEYVLQKNAKIKNSPKNGAVVGVL